MKSFITLWILGLSLTIGLNANAQGKIEKNDSVEVINTFKNLYRYQNFYIGGQPNLEALQWLKSQGVNKIINLCTEKEIVHFSENAYNEMDNAENLGFVYHNIPVDASKDYSPEKLDLFSNYLAGDEKVLIHCAGGWRATDFFMAYLIKNRGYTINEAVEIGKKLKYSLPLEKLLDVEISMNVTE